MAENCKVDDCQQNLLNAEIKRRGELLAEINRIVHVPTKGRWPAEVHFQRDFDQIRAMTAPFIDRVQRETTP